MSDSHSREIVWERSVLDEMTRKEESEEKKRGRGGEGVDEKNKSQQAVAALQIKLCQEQDQASGIARNVSFPLR